jgi:hypothetical protein
LYSDPSYWYIKEIDTNIYAEPVLFYTLYKNGDCTYNVKTKDSSERFYFGDVIVNNKWSLKNDSVISLLGYSYTCEILSKSEILLKSETETIRIIRLPE